MSTRKAICASACVGFRSASYSFSVIVSCVTRTGTMRPGPHTKRTVGTCDAGTLALAFAPADPPIDTPPVLAEALTDPRRPPEAAGGRERQHTIASAHA